MFGLTFEKLLLIGVLAAFLLGPDRLPTYAAKLAQLVKSLRSFTDGAKDRMREEMGPEFDEVDWKKLDPRQYDPRRIIREALNDSPPAQVRPPVRSDASRPSAATAAATVRPAAGPTADSPFDSEAT